MELAGARDMDAANRVSERARANQPPLPISHRRGFITAFQNRVVQVWRVNFTRVESHDYSLVGKIDNDIENTGHFHQHWPQSAHAGIAIFILGCDLDRFDNSVIGPFRIKRIAWFGFVWASRVHHLLNARRCLSGRNFAGNWLEDAPNVLGHDSLAGGVRMHVVGLIE
jgi:hypothetical protein